MPPKCTLYGLWVEYNLSKKTVCSDHSDNGNAGLFIDSLLNCNVVHTIEKPSWKRLLQPIIIMEVTAAQRVETPG